MSFFCLGILNITFKYLLEIISPILGWYSIGTFTNPCNIHVLICDTMGLCQAREQSRGSSKRNVDEAACAMAMSCLRR